MIRKLPLCASVLSVVLLGVAFAQSPADWIKRILDPAKIGVTPPPAEMAIYLMPLDQLQAASAHFKQTLGVTPETSGSGEYEIHRFTVPAKNLVIMMAKSQFVDDKVQITLTYTPPAK